MRVLENPYRLAGLPPGVVDAVPWPASDPAQVLRLLERCPRHARTPLRAVPELARAAGVKSVHVKDERARMGLGSFKALGAAYVIASEAQETALSGRTYVAASAGNHGLSVAAGAAAFGARSRIYLAETVPETFASRLREEGAEVVRAGAIYEDSMAAAREEAEVFGLDLLSDSSWPEYIARPHILMEGYLAIMAEVLDQISEPPTHVFVQAGVGGLAGAVAAFVRRYWGDSLRIVVVEPEAAPALAASIEAGHPVTTTGPVSAMGRLDCKEPSLIGLKGLARDADFFCTITEEEGDTGSTQAARWQLSSTPSGTAGLAGLIASGRDRQVLGLESASRVLTFLTEAAE